MPKPKSMEYRVWSMGGTDDAKGNPETEDTFSGHGSQSSGLWFGCSASGSGSGPHPYLNLMTRT
jgi:hypothetical protein